MSYSPAAASQSRCTQTRADGSPCRAWAVWGDEDRRCATHGGRRAPDASAACRCPAYQRPHRRGGGRCRWPDPPTEPPTVKAGTHAANRVRPHHTLLRYRLVTEKQPPRWKRPPIDGRATP